MASHERFGYEWNKYSAIVPAYEKQFSDWIFPLVKENFVAKKILDAGCGMGRNSYWPLVWGAAEVTAFDFDDRSVSAAQKNLQSFSNAKVLHSSIYDISWSNNFDIVMSIGVVHHLAEPKKALMRLVEALKPGGTLVVWLYSYEGNEWLVRYIDPVRKTITSRLPLPVVNLLTYLLSVPLWIFVKTVRGPGPYLKQLSTFKFWHIHSIVFDQLIPAVANYWKKSEIQDLFKDVGLQEYDVVRTSTGIGWTVVGTK